MKAFCAVLLALGMLAATVAEADAFVCARGPYRAGCAGPRGAVGVNRWGGAGAYRYGAYGYRGAVVRPYGYGYARPWVYRRPYLY